MLLKYWWNIINYLYGNNIIKIILRNSTEKINSRAYLKVSQVKHMPNYVSFTYPLIKLLHYHNLLLNVHLWKRYTPILIIWNLYQRISLKIWRIWNYVTSVIIRLRLYRMILLIDSVFRIWNRDNVERIQHALCI